MRQICKERVTPYLYFCTCSLNDEFAKFSNWECKKRFHSVFQVINIRLQSTEVANSNAMELDSLKRQLTYVEGGNVTVKKLVTDRHMQVSPYVANGKPEIDRAYHVWHAAKCIVRLPAK